MTRDPRRASDAEPRTDPLPVITDEMLPPLSEPRVPELDDRTLEALLAELDGADPAPTGQSRPTGQPTDHPPHSTAATGTGAPSAGAPNPGVTGTGAPSAGASGSGAAGGAGRRTGAGTGGGTGGAVGGYRLGAAGLVVTTEYGEHRPPIPPVEIDATSLTGLSRFARTRLGSRIFTLTFVLIFLAILAQALASIFTAGT